jgi:proteic killer suppression protein
MIQSFANDETEAIYNGEETKKARKVLPVELWKIAQRKLDAMEAAVELKDLASPPGNQLEALKEDRAGQHSIRINKQYRICFVWTTAGPSDVEITDYH